MVVSRVSLGYARSADRLARHIMHVDEVLKVVLRIGLQMPFVALITEVKFLLHVNEASEKQASLYMT